MCFRSLLCPRVTGQRVATEKAYTGSRGERAQSNLYGCDDVTMAFQKNQPTTTLRVQFFCFPFLSFHSQVGLYCSHTKSKPRASYLVPGTGANFEQDEGIPFRQERALHNLRHALIITEEDVKVAAIGF